MFNSNEEFPQSDKSKRYIREYPAPGITLKRSPEQHICIFVVRYASSTTIKAWQQCVLHILEAWPEAEPCLILHEFHPSRIFGFGNNLLAEFEALYWCRPELKRRVGVILPHDFGTDLIAELDIKMREVNAPFGYPVHWNVFSRRVDALNWLLHEQTSR